ncbi:ER membrane protein complex subunit 8 [Thoreauomyces humboldtii]|nr:ER membrane protein complex subunit 8 [Thoreauomyces humboldtii]
MPASYQLSSSAYAKIIHHCAKFAVHDVCGVLLGTKVGDKVVVTAALPLFHSQPLTPMLEVAMQQVEAFSVLNSLQIVGYYTANQRFDDKNINATATTVANTIEQNLGGGALLLLVDASKLQEKSALAVLPHMYSSPSWKALPSERLELTAPLDIRSIVSDRSYESLNDFESHLNNISLDWLSTSSLHKHTKVM